MRRTIPVAFILDSSQICQDCPGKNIVIPWKTWIVSAVLGKVCSFCAGFVYRFHGIRKEHREIADGLFVWRLSPSDRHDTMGIHYEIPG